MLPDLETDVLLRVEKVVHDLVVDLEIANRYQALGGFRREPLEVTSHHHRPHKNDRAQ